MQESQQAKPGPLAATPGGAIAIGGESYLIDLKFQGEPNVIAAYLVRGRDGLALIESGPGSTIDALVGGINAAGFEVTDLTALYVTHIHLDHAGAAGLLAKMNPRLKVYAHPFGVPHMVDPSKLIASASRIYGDQMQTLWGDWAPIEAERVIPFEDGQHIDLGWRSLSIHFTPGHARHHVAIFEQESGDLYSGDVAGIHIPGAGYVCPPTPPPEFDPEAWAASIALMRGLRPARLIPTHFGPVGNPGAQLDQLEAQLARFIAIGEASFNAGEDQETLTRRLHEEVMAQLPGADPELVAQFELATPSYMAAMGLTRYFSKRSEK
jgi:glyoxylase-like metal-dependent hydrolase (beta-lactamase superfamily II)